MTQNKFLDLYPQLHDPNVGDNIKIIKFFDIDGSLLKNLWGYRIGDTGKVTGITTQNKTLYEIQFDSDGELYNLYREEFEVI